MLLIFSCSFFQFLVCSSNKTTRKKCWISFFMPAHLATNPPFLSLYTFFCQLYMIFFFTLVKQRLRTLRHISAMVKKDIYLQCLWFCFFFCLCVCIVCLSFFFSISMVLLYSQHTWGTLVTRIIGLMWFSVRLPCENFYGNWMLWCWFKSKLQARNKSE